MEFSTQGVIDFLKIFEFQTTPAIMISLGSLFLYGVWVVYKVGFNELDFSDALPIALSSYSVLGGVRVIIFGLENISHSMDGTQQFYISIGGCAVIWNGCRAMRKKVISIIPKP